MASKYIVTQSTGASCDPRYSGVGIVVPCDTLDGAKRKVKELLDSVTDVYEIDLNPGDCLDGDLMDCYSPRYADHYYSESGLTAWINGQCDNWEKIEVWEFDESDGKYHLVEGPEL